MIFLNITIITHTTLHVVMSRNIFFSANNQRFDCLSLSYSI